MEIFDQSMCQTIGAQNDVVVVDRCDFHDNLAGVSCVLRRGYNHACEIKLLQN